MIVLLPLGVCFLSNCENKVFRVVTVASIEDEDLWKALKTFPTRLKGALPVAWVEALI